MGNEVRQRQVAVRIRPSVFGAGQLDGPVRSDQTERVPSPRAPRLGYPPAFEHGVVDASLAEEPADAQTGLPAPTIATSTLSLMRYSIRSPTARFDSSRLDLVQTALIARSADCRQSW